MNSSFEHISRAAVAVLARQAAIRLVKSRIQAQGLCLTSVPMRDIQIQADALLRQRPDLFAEAEQRVAAHPEWLPKRARPPVSQSDHAKTGTDNAR
jgi:hypothetical protein